MSKIRVLVVDDSALMRKLMAELFNSDPEIEVVGTAMDADVAREKIKKLKPDVLTFEVELPNMDGLSFLSNLMRLHPMPAVMASSLTEQRAKVTMRALDLGAVDFVGKPRADLAHTVDDCAVEIASKVKAASLACVDTQQRDTQGRVRFNQCANIGGTAVLIGEHLIDTKCHGGKRCQLGNIAC